MEESDCIVVMGSNMAENHPVAFRWPMKAKANGAKIIHVDPRFTRTSAMADIYAPIRAGSDVAFLGGLVNYVLNDARWNNEPWVLGAISAAAPGAQSARKVLAEPISGRIFLAGEATHETRWGTVNGAWDSGERAADAVVKLLGGPSRRT